MEETISVPTVRDAMETVSAVKMVKRKLKIKKMMKKGATISLCAVLAGGIGVGAYEGINSSLFPFDASKYMG